MRRKQRLDDVVVQPVDVAYDRKSDTASSVFPAEIDRFVSDVDDDDSERNSNFDGKSMASTRAPPSVLDAVISDSDDEFGVPASGGKRKRRRTRKKSGVANTIAAGSGDGVGTGFTDTQVISTVPTGFAANPDLDLRDCTTAKLFLRSPSGRLDTVTVLVVRDTLGYEIYWYPVWPFFRYVGYSHNRHADQLLAPTMIRTYDELRCVYPDLPANLELKTRYMNDDGMSVLLYQKSRIEAMNEMRVTLRETMQQFFRSRLFALVQLVKTVSLQYCRNMLPPPLQTSLSSSSEFGTNRDRMLLSSAVTSVSEEGDDHDDDDDLDKNGGVA